MTGPLFVLALSYRGLWGLGRAAATVSCKLFRLICQGVSGEEDYCGVDD
jgi:hypothetical protein